MSGYQVGSVNASEINPTWLRAWLIVYAGDINREHCDPHQEFSEMIGKSRYDAKMIAHKIAYTCSVACRNLGH